MKPTIKQALRLAEKIKIGKLDTTERVVLFKAGWIKPYKKGLGLTPKGKGKLKSIEHLLVSRRR